MPRLYATLHFPSVLTGFVLESEASMKRAAVSLLSTILLLLLVTARADEEILQGFTPQSSAQEREWEAKYKAIPNPDNQREYMRRLTAHPHHVGSPYDKENAEWILSKYKE